MKNTMKKTLSLILVIIMLLTAMPFAYAEGNTYEVGDIIQFGSYPQSKVTDEALLAELNALAPEWEDWISYGYYSGTESWGSMKQGDWMRYTDITYNGNKYRGVKFTQYRPYYTHISSTSYTYQDDNGYSTNTVYWFKFEPIDWRVLDPVTGLVMCEAIIDSQSYSNTVYFDSGVGEYFNDASYTNYGSDYETSSIRKWLNEDFYNIAFNDSEKQEINTTTLNNDGYYTSVGTTGYEKYDSKETKDKIFLLSYNEVRNSNLGFESSLRAPDKARVGQGSDYAQSQGLYVYRSLIGSADKIGNSYWLLRSPGQNCVHSGYVGLTGSSGNTHVDYTMYGVRPALRSNRISNIGQSEHQHDHSSVVTEPTCTTQGYTTYTCSCGDRYVVDYTDKLGHSYTSSITTEPTHLTEGIKTFTCECGDNYTEPVAKLESHIYTLEVTKEPLCTQNGSTTYTCSCGDTYSETIEATGHNFDGSKCIKCGYDKADDCSCNCHKKGISNFFFKIILFFQKIFKKNAVCACGAFHY